jgi:hypothetical protein
MLCPASVLGNDGTDRPKRRTPAKLMIAGARAAIFTPTIAGIANRVRRGAACCARHQYLATTQRIGPGAAV